MKNKKRNKNNKPLVKSNFFIGILIGLFALISGALTVLILRFLPTF